MYAPAKEPMLTTGCPPGVKSAHEWTDVVFLFDDFELDEFSDGAPNCGVDFPVTLSIFSCFKYASPYFTE